MSLHKSELRITVVEDLEWPALQECSILTPHSLFPRDVTLDEDSLSVLRLTPNSARSGKFAWTDNRTSSTNHTFGFPLSPASTVSKFPSGNQSPLEKHKRRLKRYNAAEWVLARLPVPSPLSPHQLRAEAIDFAASFVAVRVKDARLCLRAALISGRRDTTRWMAERRLVALESLQAKLTLPELAQGGDGDNDKLRRREANLVRFLSVRKGEGLVPVFTRSRGRRPLIQTTGEPERRCMTVGSPMKLQSDAMPAPPTAKNEWPWETRLRAVLLYPKPKPPVSPLRILTQTPTSATMSTPTSGSLSPIEPETPLTEPEDEDDEDDYEDYPTFKMDSALSYPSDWLPRHVPRASSSSSSSSSWLPARPKPEPAHPPLPPLTTNLSPDATYAWLSDPSTWASPSGWHGDGWEVAATPTSASSTASPATSSPDSPTTRTPSPVHTSRIRSQTLPPPPTHRFWTRERHQRLPSLRPIAETTRDAAAYAVRPLPLPPQAPEPLRALPPPPTPQKKGLHFFSGLVRRKHDSSSSDLQVEVEREERERNKLRKRGSVRSLRSSNSFRSLRDQ